MESFDCSWSSEWIYTLVPTSLVVLIWWFEWNCLVKVQGWLIVEVCVCRHLEPPNAVIVHLYTESIGSQSWFRTLSVANISSLAGVVQVEDLRYMYMFVGSIRAYNCVNDTTIQLRDRYLSTYFISHFCIYSTYFLYLFFVCSPPKLALPSVVSGWFCCYQLSVLPTLCVASLYATSVSSFMYLQSFFVSNVRLYETWPHWELSLNGDANRT